jgi:putative Mg2+ transporter-C (MgtC) family protein
MRFIELYRVQFQVLAYVGLAMLLGVAIGFEHEVEGKPAGLRTHMLVAGAAALLVGLSDVMVRRFDVSLSNELVRSDPVRIIQAVITGVSFLGAETIIRHGAQRQVEGLTTAASILFAAAMGVCVALSQIVLAVGVTVLVLVTLRGVGFAQHWLGQRQDQATSTSTWTAKDSARERPEPDL